MMGFMMDFLGVTIGKNIKNQQITNNTFLCDKKN